MPNVTVGTNLSFAEASPMDFPDVGNLSTCKGRLYRLAILISHPVQYFAPLLQYLARQPEIDLTVLYCSLQGARTMKDPDFGVSFAWDIPLLKGYRYKKLRNYWPRQPNGFFSCINPGVITELRKGDYDAVIVFGWGSFTNWLAFAGAKLAGIPWMIYGDSIDLYENDRGWTRRRLKHLVLGTLFQNTAGFLTMGKLNRLFYQRYGASPERFFFVPYAVDNQFFHSKAVAARLRGKELRAQHGIPQGAILLLFAGKLIPRKRPEDLLAALQILQPDIPNLAIAFVGDGELCTFLETRISCLGVKNAKVLGFKNQTALPDVYAMADILVMPSSRENWGLVVNEAMACGLPVIASHRCGASADIVRDSENGFVYPCGDIGALAQAIRKLATNPDLRRRMGHRSWEIIQSFGYEKCVEGILSALRFAVRKERLRKGR